MALTLAQGEEASIGAGAAVASVLSRSANRALADACHIGLADDAAMRAMPALRKLDAEPGLRLVELPVPEPAEDEVLVEVEAASVCGTDLHIDRWDAWAQRRISPPLTLGHEFAGTIVDVGRGVRHAAVGDYVSAESHVTCGICFHCRTGHAHMCERTRILGVDRDGAFARYVAVPESVVWQNDREQLPPEIAALQEPFGNAVFATSEQDLAGRSVAVLGCGPIGLFAIGIARASGAAVVVAADRSPFRLTLAERMGASAVVDVEGVRDEASWFLEHHEGLGFDVVFEMSGAGRAVKDAFRIARNGGRVVLFGIPERPVTIDVAETLVFKNLEVRAVSGRKIFETWYRTRWLLESGVVDVRPLITHELPLEQFESAFQALEAGEACKIVLYPGEAPTPARWVTAEALA
jgi:threonine 3-dehydrogenase